MKLSEYVAYCKKAIRQDGLRVFLNEHGQFQVEGGSIPKENNLYFYMLRRMYPDRAEGTTNDLDRQFVDDASDNAWAINVATGGPVRRNRRAHWFRRILIRELLDTGE